MCPTVCFLKRGMLNNCLSEKAVAKNLNSLLLVFFMGLWQNMNKRFSKFTLWSLATRVKQLVSPIRLFQALKDADKVVCIQQKGEVLCVAFNCVAKWKKNEFAKDVNHLSHLLISFHCFFNVLSAVQWLLKLHTMILNSHANLPLPVFEQSHLTIITFCLLCVTWIGIWSFQALPKCKSGGMVADDCVST